MPTPFMHLYFADRLRYRLEAIDQFVGAAGLGESHEGYYLHNVALIVLDQLCYRQLPPRLDGVRMAAKPCHWLPFAADDDLSIWRNYLAEQLSGDSEPLTAHIYAERMSIPITILHDNLNDVEWLQRSFYARVPLNVIEAKLEATVSLSLTAVRNYLDGFVLRKTLRRDPPIG